MVSLGKIEKTTPIISQRRIVEKRGRIVYCLLVSVPILRRDYPPAKSFSYGELRSLMPGLIQEVHVRRTNLSARDDKSWRNTGTPSDLKMEHAGLCIPIDNCNGVARAAAVAIPAPVAVVVAARMGAVVWPVVAVESHPYDGFSWL